MRLNAFVQTFTLCWSAAVSGAELVGSDSVAAPGGTVVIPLSIVSHGATVGGVQFDVTADDSLSTVILLGGGARTTGKNLYQAALGAHSARCLIVGLNQKPILDGELIRLFVSVQASAAPGIQTLTFTNVFAVDPQGQGVAIDKASAHVTVQSGDTVGQIVQPAGVLNAATMLSGPVAPGEIITLLGPGTESFSPPVGSDNLSVWFNDLRAPLMYVGNNQINAVVPFGLPSDIPTSIKIHAQDRTLASSTVPVASVQPGIFTQDYSGAGPGAILNENFTLNSFTNPAERGSIIMVFTTGFGQTNPPAADGQPIDDARFLKASVLATIGDQDAEVTYAGSAPGLISGIAQVNVRVPAGVLPGPAVPVALRTGTAETQTGVTLSIR